MHAITQKTSLELLMFDGANPRRVCIETDRFSLGRSEENDLVIASGGVARRHALIERFEDLIRVIPCDPTAETFVNGVRIANAAPLHDRDLLRIGDECEIEVRIHRGQALASREYRGQVETGGQIKAEESVISRRDFITASVSAIGAVTAASFFVIRGNKKGMPDSLILSPVSGPAEKIAEPVASTGSGNRSQRLRGYAVQAVSQISRDSRAYVFDDEHIGEIEDRVNRYQTSAILNTALGDLNARGSNIARRIDREMQPALVFYTAIGEMLFRDRSEDIIRLADTVIGKLREVGRQFGTVRADSCLLTVAGYRMNSTAMLRTSVPDPYADRTVWHLKKTGRISKEAYEFVLVFLAVAVIAQSPKSFGIDAESCIF